MNGYQAPGRPLPILQRREVHSRVVAATRQFLRTAGFREVPLRELAPAAGIATAFPEDESHHPPRTLAERRVTEYTQNETGQRDLDLLGLCDLQERLLKQVAGCLTADQIGGANLTRLTRMIAADHPHLRYREAFTILQRRGFMIDFGDTLNHEAEAALVYHCGNLPLHVTHLPASLRLSSTSSDRHDPLLAECAQYLLPHAGATFGSTLREPNGRAGFGLCVARLLQYLMGLDSVHDAVVSAASESGG